MKLYIESTSGGFDFLTGEHYGSTIMRSGSLVGVRQGSRISLALVDRELSDTNATFTGDIVGDTLIGSIRAPGGFNESVRYIKTSRRD
jgi:hypothetical protein